jgi:hypothetical protein
VLVVILVVSALGVDLLVLASQRRSDGNVYVYARVFIACNEAEHMLLRMGSKGTEGKAGRPVWTGGQESA